MSKCVKIFFLPFTLSALLGVLWGPTLIHDRVSGRLGPSDVDVMLGTMRKKYSHALSIPAVKSAVFTGSSSFTIGFSRRNFRFKFTNRQKNFVFIVSRILRYGTGGRSGLSFGQEQNLYGRLTPRA